ncbi:helix-turn-helix transcriptional regulator [Glycomyces halotolerans]
MDRQQLADFLRVRRAAIRPGDVGLPEGSRRRTPGLRRQEVAQLAGISVEYYIRLEQARSPKPSAQVLGALARALVLDRDERAHLFHLVGDPPDPIPPDREVPDSVLNLLGGLGDFPAFVVNAAYDMIAWNRLSAVFMPFLEELEPEQRNILRRSFTSPDFAEHLADPYHEAFLRECVADVRAGLARNPNDASLRSLVDQLLRASPEFGAMWADHEVRVRNRTTKRIDHPDAGPIEVDCQVFEVTGFDLRLIMYVPVPGSPSAAAIAKLRQMAATVEAGP